MKSALITFLLLSSFILNAQVHLAQELSNTISEQAKARPLENVYLRTSKEVYETSEDLWFSARVLHSQLHRLSSLSQTIYLELRSVAEEGPVYRELFNLQNGLSQGHFFLPDSLETGEYRLTAFTAHSVKQVNAPLESVRRIMIKKKIVPHILIQTTFDEEFYVEEQPITGTVRLVTPGGDPVTDAKMVVSLLAGNKNEDRNRLRSDSTGRATFSLKSGRNPATLSLSVRVDHEGHEEFFSQPVPYHTTSSVQLQFLPEGGRLLGRMSNTVAFKAVDKSGMPFEIADATLMADGKGVLSFGSEHAGMGSFAFFANPQAHYTVQVNEPLVDSVYVLPEVHSSGMKLLLIRESDEFVTVGVAKTMNLPVDSVHVGVRQRGMLTWVGAAKMNKEGKLFNVPKRNLLTGIAEFVLFDQDHQAVSSRLVYVGGDRKLKVTAEMDKESYGVKELVTLKLKVTDNENQPVQTLLTLAATDELYRAAFAEKNIMTHYLLESELKGNIYDPAYYFDNDNAERLAHLDLLLLTQGWRDYEWSPAVLMENLKVDTLPMVDHVVGQVDRFTLPGRLRKRPEVSVQIISGGGAMELTTDSTGSFPLVPEFLAMSEGTDVIMKVQESDRARLSFVTGFDHMHDQLEHQHIEYGMLKPRAQFKNWDKLPQFEGPAQEVMGVVVTDTKSSYGKLNGMNGHYLGNNKDYVCQYNILNCRNHPFGTKPIVGHMYRVGARYVVYELPEPEAYPNTFKGYYKSPRFYEPIYDERPEEKLIPDFRNTLVWQPELYTNENGEATVTFWTSDIRSVFNGWVEGIGANGHFGLGKFQVKVLK